MLDQLVGRLSFDPLAFSLRPAKDQRADLLALLDLPLNPDEIAARRRGLFEERTQVNRQARHLTERLAAMPAPPEGLPAQEQPATEVLAELRGAQEAQRRYEDLMETHQQLETSINQALAEIKRLRAQVSEWTTERIEVLGLLAEFTFTPEAVVARVEQKLERLEATNRAVREAGERASVQGDLEATTAEADRLTDAIAGLDDELQKAVEAAPMPVPGLGFDEDGITYGGVPFAQCSAAERLRVSVAMAMAANPKIRVIRVADGSLLDDDNLKLIADLAAEHDFQVWVERVGDGDPLAVVIEDGAVKEEQA
jgi:hypothetical protein